MMRVFWAYKVIKPVVSGDKVKRHKRIKLINKAFGGKDGTQNNKGTKKRS